MIIRSIIEGLDKDTPIRKDVVKKVMDIVHAEGIEEEYCSPNRVNLIANDHGISDLTSEEVVYISDNYKAKENEEVEGEPTEDDITTEDYETWYQYGKLFYTGDEKGLKAELDKGNLFPDIWWVSDHGNTNNITKSIYNESDEGDFKTLGSGMDKETAERLAKEQGGTVVADDESDEELYSVIKKEAVR